MRSCPRVVRSWLALLIGHCSGRIGPIMIRDQWIPAWPAGVAIVRIAAEVVEQRVVARELFAIERNAQSGRVGNADRAVDVAEGSAFDHVVDEMMIMRVGRVAEGGPLRDRKSTCLNSSHVSISYAVFCLK